MSGFFLKSICTTYSEGASFEGTTAENIEKENETARFNRHKQRGEKSHENQTAMAKESESLPLNKCKAF